MKKLIDFSPFFIFIRISRSLSLSLFIITGNIAVFLFFLFFNKISLLILSFHSKNSNKKKTGSYSRVITLFLLHNKVEKDLYY